MTRATPIVRRSGREPPPVDPNSIHSVADSPAEPHISRAMLAPEEEAISLPGYVPERSPLDPLTRFLGPLLTVASPAWGDDPVPRMRALQKKLVEHSLTLAEGSRADCMAAISVVEDAVHLRLRLQQMHMSEAEMELKEQSEAAS